MPTHRMPSDFNRKLIEMNLAEYGKAGRDLNFITPRLSKNAELERTRILSDIALQVQWEYKQTKPFLNDLSPGCRICGNGHWSCLFINGKCNCRCFYCPTPQNDIGVPTTNLLEFTKASDYSDYVRYFGFQGVSISGGEPLLTFEKTIDFIRTVRRNSPAHLHVWMYTNGTLLTHDHILRLKDAGLNEIRFDIGATNYDIEKLLIAVGHISCVTVEIPAIPEDMDRLSALIPLMTDVGVQYLNLHQLRLTPHNSPLLKNKKYTFLHGEKVTVLESELAVLSLFSRAIQNGWTLPINYCSFAYKHRFQQKAVRKRNAEFIIKSHESLTENGFIRGICLKGESKTILSILDGLNRHNVPKELHQINGNKTTLLIHQSLWPMIDITGCEIQLNYYEAVLTPALSYRHVFKEILLNKGRKLYVEKQSRCLGLPLSADQKSYFEKRVILKNQPPGQCPSELEWIDYEFTPEGMQPYF